MITVCVLVFVASCLRLFLLDFTNLSSTVIPLGLLYTCLFPLDMLYRSTVLIPAGGYVVNANSTCLESSFILKSKKFVKLANLVYKTKFSIKIQIQFLQALGQNDIRRNNLIHATQTFLVLGRQIIYHSSNITISILMQRQISRQEPRNKHNMP